MNLVVGLEAQPEFPQQDLTERNAEFLELMLANHAVVTNSHEFAEMGAWAFKVGHPAIRAGVEQVYDGDRVVAIEHGVMVFEAMNVAVVGLAASNDMIVVNRAATGLLRQATSEGRLAHQVINAIDVFKAQMPRSAEVLVSASRRFVGPLTDYALLGAALEREIALADILLPDDMIP